MPRHHYVRLAALIVALARPGVLGAQAGVPRAQARHSLDAADVVRAALADNTQVRTAWLRIEMQRGDVLMRQSPFDMQLSSVVQGNQAKERLGPTDYAREQGKAYRVVLSKQLRSGITIAPALSVSSSRFMVPGAQSLGSASASVDVTTPLLYDRGGAVSTTSVRIGEMNHEVMRGSWRAAAFDGANAALGAYWSYVAAIRRVQVQQDAEARARRLLDETTQLVQKEERAPADLQQLRATVASRRAARILAEQAVDEARVVLGVQMGLDAPGTLAIGEPATDFPVAGSVLVGDAATLVRLQDIALQRRQDLATHRLSNRAWDLEHAQLRSAMQPRLDLAVTLGYQGSSSGVGNDHLVSPLFRNVPGLNASVQLRYAHSPANSSPRGQLIRHDAQVQQERIALRDIERQVTTDVSVSALGVDRAAAALRDAEEAVALYRLSVDNEQRRLRLGMNTLFDVINSEDALTTALLTAINNRRAYAAALASLRVATGTLLDFVGDQPTIDAVRLLSTP